MWLSGAPGTVGLGEGNAFGYSGGLVGLVVAVTAGQVLGEAVELADPGAQPESEDSKGVGGAAQGVAAVLGGVVGSVVDGVEQSGDAGALGPPLVEEGAGSPGRSLGAFEVDPSQEGGHSGGSLSWGGWYLPQWPLTGWLGGLTWPSAVGQGFTACVRIGEVAIFVHRGVELG